MAFLPVPSFPPPSRSLSPRLCASPSSDDWRYFRARLIRPTSTPHAFLHALPRPEPGALLLATPEFFTSSQRYFWRAVIMLFAHSEKGSAGVLLNKNATDAEGDGLPQAPWGWETRLGGDVGLDSLLGLYEGDDGVCWGEGERVKQMVEQGALNREQVKGFYSRYCGWGEGQLEREIERGVWTVAAAGKDWVLADQKGMWESIQQELGKE